MKQKYTFWSLCKAYSKIEIPIIQRDYAQGRQTPEVEILREKFINEFLIEAIVKEQPIELDFVYGSILIETKEELKLKTFIPLDGQQRLTTLFLLYYFLAVKENRLNEISGTLSKFTYETRPSAHDFCVKILEKGQFENVIGIKDLIEDSVWFNEEWKEDPTVSGMLTMLETFSKNQDLTNTDVKLLDKILDDENQLVSFYFTDLEEFGLTENLYIRMNARGKLLTSFENFKSEFYKIIQNNHTLLNEVKDKIEYSWVDNLWEYKKADVFIIDKPFMSYLSFITEMLYFKNAEFRSSNPYASNFVDFKILEEIYSKEENLRFFIFSLDFIKNLKNLNKDILWGNLSLHRILREIVSDNKRDINQMFVLYGAINYSFNKKEEKNLMDYVRVVRNLIANTDDNSRREWPRLLSSIENLISDENVYEVLLNLNNPSLLIGFNQDQRNEEVFKAKLFQDFPKYKESIFKIEDHRYLTGRITNLLLSPFSNSDKDFEKKSLVEINYTEKDLKHLNKIFKSYDEISANAFNNIWGNLIITDLYKQTADSRLIFGSFKRNPSIILFAKNYSKSGLVLSDFIIKIQKEFVTKLITNYSDFSEIKNVKEQLYLYFIIGARLYDQKYPEFFKNHYFNFGWLKKEKGYKSLFSNGIKDCISFSTINPIFQVYNQQFRYNLGINSNNTLDIENLAVKKIKNPFEKIKTWATS